MIGLKERQLAEIVVLVALALLLDFLAGIYSDWIWLQGGTISQALIPLAVLSYRHGWKIGLLGATLMGSIKILTANHLFYPIQVLLDYPIAFGVLGLVGLWSKNLHGTNPKNPTFIIMISTLVASFFQFIAHTISGWLFFGQWAPEGVHPLWNSIVYNAGYLFLSWLVSVTVLVLLYYSSKKIFQFQSYEEDML